MTMFSDPLHSLQQRVTHFVICVILVCASSSLMADVGMNEVEMSVPLRLHVIDNLVMNKQGVSMQSWISDDALMQTVLAEVNRIWRPANIVFRVAQLTHEPALNPANKNQLIQQIVNAQRDSSGKSDPLRIRSLDSLIDWRQPDAMAIDVYLVPYLGETSQGNTRIKLKRIVLAQWTDKYSHAQRPPERCLLVEKGVLKRGSLSRTLAHELGHVLGLKHPQKQRQTQFGLLMGGREAGYALTKKHIRKARKQASMLIQDQN